MIDIVLTIALSVSPLLIPVPDGQKSPTDAKYQEVMRLGEETLLKFEQFYRRRAKEELELERVEAELNTKLKESGGMPLKLAEPGLAAEMLQKAEELRHRREKLFPPKPPAVKKG